MHGDSRHQWMDLIMSDLQKSAPLTAVDCLHVTPSCPVLNCRIKLTTLQLRRRILGIRNISCAWELRMQAITTYVTNI
jgi:hypothetical protein